MADLKDEIAANASGPKQVSGDAATVTQHDLSQQIEADKHLSAQTGVNQANRGMRFSKFVPPGAV